MKNDILRDILIKCKKFESDANKILSIHETSSSRAILLEESYTKLGEMSVQQDELFRESLRCVEKSLFRAAHVLAWAGFIDFITEILNSNATNLKQIRPNWKFKTKQELAEPVPDYQIIEASKELDLISKNEQKALKGLLSKRNECAHPSGYFPNLNETLGYISELFHRINDIKAKNQ